MSLFLWIYFWFIEYLAFLGEREKRTYLIFVDLNKRRSRREGKKFAENNSFASKENKNSTRKTCRQLNWNDDICGIAKEDFFSLSRDFSMCVKTCTHVSAFKDERERERATYIMETKQKERKKNKNNACVRRRAWPRELNERVTRDRKRRETRSESQYICRSLSRYYGGIHKNHVLKLSGL